MSERKCCVVCRDIYTAKRTDQKYCSKLCMDEARRLRRARLDPNRPKRACRICGTEFLPIRGDQLQCSFECSKVANNSGLPKANGAVRQVTIEREALAEKRLREARTLVSELHNDMGYEISDELALLISEQIKDDRTYQINYGNFEDYAHTNIDPWKFIG